MMIVGIDDIGSTRRADVNRNVQSGTLNRNVRSAISGQPAFPARHDHKGFKDGGFLYLHGVISFFHQIASTTVTLGSIRRVDWHSSCVASRRNHP